MSTAGPPDLRTTMLVALAASLAMIQVNLLLPLAGRPVNSFVMNDLMRLPLGILSGMGFIGAGAIVRRQSGVLGVTTAATLMVCHLLGLIFGGGQIALGLTGLTLGMLVLSGLRSFERRLLEDRIGLLTVIAHGAGPSAEDVRAGLAAQNYKILSCAVVHFRGVKTRKLTWRVGWRAAAREEFTPAIVRALSAHPGVVKVTWTPQAG